MNTFKAITSSLLIPVYAVGITYSYLLGKFEHFTSYPETLIDIPLRTITGFILNIYVKHWSILLVLAIFASLLISISIVVKNEKLQKEGARNQDLEWGWYLACTLSITVYFFTMVYIFDSAMKSGFLGAAALVLILMILLLPFTILPISISKFSFKQMDILRKNRTLQKFSIIFMIISIFYSLALYANNEGKNNALFPTVRTSTNPSLNLLYLGSVDSKPMFYDCNNEGGARTPYISEWSKNMYFGASQKMKDCLNAEAK